MTFLTLAQAQNIVPKPQEIKAGEDEPFALTSKTRITIVDETMRPIAEYLAAHLQPATGFFLQVVTEKPAAGDIQLTNLYSDIALGDEGYT
ncbi:MAG: glycoside hydrolase family 20 zincin-like fold domain-containing protein, partial [Bryobacteraceae bacterium]